MQTVRALKPFSPNLHFCYFEVTIVDGGEKNSVGLGLVDSKYKHKIYPVRFASSLWQVAFSFFPLWFFGRDGMTRAMGTTATMAEHSTTQVRAPRGALGMVLAILSAVASTSAPRRSFLREMASFLVSCRIGKLIVLCGSNLLVSCSRSRLSRRPRHRLLSHRGPP